MSDKKKRRTRAIGAGVGVGAAVVAALFTLGLIGMSSGGGGGSPGWIRTVEKGLGQRGFDWITIDVADRVATVSGEAPDVDSQQYGFEAAEAALTRAPEAADAVGIVVDATSVTGGPAGFGAALKALGLTPDLGACQAAFTATLEGRTINFELGSAALTPDNKRLLDALSAVAVRCKAYGVEVGGHTDRSGGAAANLDLSQRRAAAVRDYLVNKGVAGDHLSARGYGDTRPLDPARTPAADARNRRIEFTVSAI